MKLDSRKGIYTINGLNLASIGLTLRDDREREAKRMLRQIFRKRSFACGLILCVCAFCCLSRHTTVHADGLHCMVLDGEDLEKVWRRVVRETWPSNVNGIAPRMASYKTWPRIELAIKEMLAVLQFVDPYNYADDSPSWMSSEEGRENARKQAEKILIELGRGAADFIWDNLTNEYRFKTSQGEPDKFVMPFRNAQKKLQAEIVKLEGIRRTDTAYANLMNKMETLRTSVNLLKFIERDMSRLRREKIRANNNPPLLEIVDAEYQAHMKKKQELGELNELTKALTQTRAELKSKAEALDKGIEAAEQVVKVAAARKELEKWAVTSMGLGQGFVTEGDPAMVTSGNFINDLQGILIAMGPEALPTILRGRRYAHPELRKVAEFIMQQWKSSRYAKAFALAMGDGKTPVAIEAEKFLTKVVMNDAVKPLVESLETAKTAEIPFIIKALKAITLQDLPDDPKSWADWYGKKYTVRPGDRTGQQDDEDEEMDKRR